MRPSLRWSLLLAVVVALFFWKILFTNQFSIIIGWEGANQAYAWYNFATKSIQQGILPLWDPYSYSGRTYVGETQTGLFYPLKVLLYLWPLGKGGLLSEKLFHQIYVLAHLLGAWFLFLCAKELGIKDNFSAFVAASCFTLAGYTGNQGWVHQMDSAIWLPLIFLFLLRALKSPNTAGGALYACFSGLCMGMAILAGSIHAPLMDGVVVISAAIYSAFQAADCPAPRVLGRPLLWSGFVALVVAVVSFASASLQLLPSMEYAPLALRWTNAGGALFYQRIPYDVVGQSHRLTPRSLFAFLFGAGDVGGGEFSTYFGVMPLLLTAIGLCRNWARPWVRYLSVLGALCYFWSMGNYSLLHGLLYVLLPFADKACEAGRFIYLTHFAMALLAGFGVQSLLSGDGAAQSFFVKLSRILQWTASAALLALGVPAVLGKPEVSDWPYVSLLFLIATWATFLYIVRGNRNGVARLVLFVVIVCDVYVFNWTALNKTHEEKTGKNHLAELLSARELADFFKRQPGLFRVHLGQGFSPSSIGDVFGIQTTGGWGATSLESYLPALWSPNGLCLFNARYIVEAGTNRQETPIFTSGAWKVYEIPSHCPRAWVVHEVVVDPSSESVLKRIQQAKLDLLRVGYLSEPMEAVLGAGSATPAEISFLRYQANEFELEVNASSSGLLVLSEIYYPGWVATVNGTTAHIYKVDGMLRGVLVSPGPNRVLMRYEPRFIPVGIALSATAFLGTFGLAVFLRNRRKRDYTSRPGSIGSTR